MTYTIKHPQKKKESDSDKDRKAVKFIFEYAQAEKGSFCFGTVFLVLGQVSDVTIPMFIGFIVDLLREGRFDEIGKWCLVQFLIVLVSTPNASLVTNFGLNTGCWYCSWLQSRRLQHSQ